MRMTNDFNITFIGSFYVPQFAISTMDRLPYYIEIHHTIAIHACKLFKIRIGMKKWMKLIKKITLLTNKTCLLVHKAFKEG